MPEQLANLIGVGLEWLVAILGGLLVAFWVGLIVWTWRDIRTRSSDIFAALLAALLVALFNVIGVLLYLLLRPKHTLAEQYDRALEEEALLREIEKAPSCHHCGRPVETDWRYCPYCETELRQPCPQCGALLAPEWKRCPHCGAFPNQTPITEPEPEFVAPPPPPTEIIPAEAVDERPAPETSGV
ncbi:MAG: zinc ribbon domain-containing protein [Chloroflexi bacterium]|nr:zinc ribbon domain-containing protein [Chloroflexota bacterium]